MTIRQNQIFRIFILIVYLVLIENCFAGAQVKMRLDTIIQLLKNQESISFQDFIYLNLNSPNYTSVNNDSVDCDTTIQLNKNIFYSIIGLQSMGPGICYDYLIVSVNSEKKQIVAWKLLMSDCDADLTKDVFTAYDFMI